MRINFIGLIFMVITFFIGIWGQYLFFFQSNPVNKSSIDDIKPKEISLSRIIDAREFLGRGPIYRFPKNGLYFSTIKDKDEQSEFFIDLLYTKNYKIRKIRGVSQEYETLVVGAEISHGKRAFNNVSVKINKEKIKLKTSNIKGVEYEFEGTFTKDEYFESEFNDQIVLKGIWRKFFNRKLIFEKEVEFTYEVGC